MYISEHLLTPNFLPQGESRLGGKIEQVRRMPGRGQQEAMPLTHPSILNIGRQRQARPEADQTFNTLRVMCNHIHAENQIVPLCHIGASENTKMI